MKTLQGRLPLLLICLALLTAVVLVVTAQDSDGGTDEDMDAQLERGEYLVHIAGCFACHSPYQEEYNVSPEELTFEQIETLSLFPVEALDLEERFMAGGRPFDLGMLGVLYSANLTPHEETGIGTWSDDQIEVAIRFGVNPSGRVLFPLMPYLNYRRLAESDVDAIIAFLHTLEPVENDVDRSGPSGEGLVPPPDPDVVVPDTPPDGSDPVELGAYLVNLMSCTDCHTPLDPETGAPLMDMFLAGGQAYEGPWGIVYAGNLTSDEETGIGTWTDDDIRRVFREGVNTEGRQLILMPWEDYSFITDEDLDALIAYLRTLEPVENAIPEPSIDEAFIQFNDDE